MLFYDWFARTYHWTPDVVDGLSDEQFFWFPVIDTARGIAMDQLRDK